jgi:hypothetical protein
MSRGPNGKLLAWTNVLYNGRNVFGKPKQLNVGVTGVRLLIGKADVMAAGIPSGPGGICKETGANAGKFERNVYAYDKAGKEVKLATYGIDDEGKTTVESCSEAALSSVARLGPALKGQGAETIEKVAALKRFSITLTSAPAAEYDGAAREEDEEGAEDVVAVLEATGEGNEGNGVFSV